jgi:lipopolysaccharide biosynthesis glycosyltransferase
MTMNICLSFDRAFVTYALATMNSVHANGLTADDTLAWWLTPADDVPTSVLDVMADRARPWGQVHVLRVPATADSLPRSSWDIMSRISSAAHYRLLLPELLPAAVERVLYLDCDLICTGRLAPLWRTDLRGELLGAVRDPGAPTISAALGLPGFRTGARRLKFWSDYFNSGVLLMDLQRCRTENLTATMLTYVQDSATRLRFVDQDALNFAVDDRWLRLERRWNDMIMGQHLDAQVEAFFHGYQRGRDAAVEPGILHFAGAEKPWDDSFPDANLKALYEKYLW